MCFGVRDAIALAHEHAASGPLTILGALVHNGTVMESLAQRGIRVVSEVSAPGDGLVMITAHGTSQRRLEDLRQSGRQVVEATCPLVHAAHRALRELVAEGRFPVIVGLRDHVEVRGMTGDLDEFAVVLSAADVGRVPERGRYGVVAQTTQPLERVAALVAALRERFPGADVRAIDTVCQPTKLRQSSASLLASRSSVVLVIGGARSNNTRELAATCARHCPRVHQVEGAADLRGSWFLPSDTVGITAGTSTPDDVIREVEEWLGQFEAFQQRLAEVP
jgi:4-hydroxy-3-methylbut-2-enyl diphosphate reductase